jgi:hypothetical protein
MVVTSPHDAVMANGANASGNDTIAPPSHAGVPPDISLATGDRRWWDSLDQDSGVVAAAASADPASVLLPLFEDAGDSDDDDRSHERIFTHIVSPEAVSIYSGIPDAIPCVTDDIREMLQEAWHI